nr:sulfite exporter TauE/SafE family protein [Paenalcaligenes hominis]
MELMQMMGEDVINYALMAVVIATAAFLQGVGGVGFAMLAAPIAVILAPEMVPGCLLVLGGSVSFLAAIRERHEIVIPVVSWALVGRTIGTVLAAVGMTQLSKEWLGLWFGGFIFIAVLLSASGIKVRANAVNVCGLGVASGMMGTLTSVGAPAIAIAMQSLKPVQLRPSLGSTLFVGSILSIISLALAGLFTWKDLLLGLVLWPFMFLGFYLSGRARHVVSPKNVRLFLLWFCGISSVMLIAKSLIAWLT